MFVTMSGSAVTVFNKFWVNKTTHTWGLFWEYSMVIYILPIKKCKELFKQKFPHWLCFCVKALGSGSKLELFSATLRVPDPNWSCIQQFCGLRIQIWAAFSNFLDSDPYSEYGIANKEKRGWIDWQQFIRYLIQNFLHGPLFICNFSEDDFKRKF